LRYAINGGLASLKNIWAGFQQVYKLGYLLESTIDLFPYQQVSESYKPHRFY